jgi:CBS domain-containing protein
MGEKNVGAVLVIEDNVLKGVLSERDYARKIVLKTKLQRYFVHEIMARDVITVKPTDNLDYCMELMSTKESDIYRFLKTTRFWVYFDRRCSEIYHRNSKETIQYLDSYISGKNHNKE